MKRVALVFAYGQNDDGSIDKQTEARCETAVELCVSGYVDKVYLTCGVSKNGRQMVDEMAAYLKKCGVWPQDIIVDPRGFNTAGEIDAFLKLAADDEVVTAVSSWYHLPRIWFLFWIRGQTVRAAASCGGVKYSDYLLWEPLKMINAVLRPFSSAKINPPVKETR